ncbi:cysteine desulfurase [Gloeobacter kilaueensis]|uniref:Cysteine desulfurase n=1 Tax=Gloeobacter kilaueensis (strain ATCC BAA-2537 / CCAP 1431/1 / ULC 316 / JS1) TaxID=1183438 RepID=U5QKN5_GLOK1|nr:cysteine desulfurase [Gloeobacter kilaueensis]AGY58179.1 cysteine desulfurase, SufS subfamily [Gloeobacter kilaueensis JS1]
MTLTASTSTTRLTPAAVAQLRADFPILGESVHGKPLVYLDNAASTQKPQAVIDAISRLYTSYYANIHRGVHQLSQLSTAAHDEARRKVQRFINARSDKEIIFVRGCTEAINLVAQTFGRQNIGPGDEILITAMEHHSNIVPWQMLCQEKGAVLKVAPISDQGELLVDAYEKLLGERTKLVALVHLSNALGTINPVRQLVELAHARSIPVLLDGAQAVSHIPVDVQALDCDFYTFSGHKLYGPTGIGVLYGKEERLEAMPPWQGGGDMIRSVSFEKTTFSGIPFKFEAGTPDICGAIALGVAIDYVQQVGLAAIADYEAELLSYATEQIQAVPGVRLIGTAREKASVLSFVIDGVHPHDIGTILDQQGVAIRAGHHCAQPVMQRLKLPATARASFAFYNTRAEVDALVAAVYTVQEMFG